MSESECDATAAGGARHAGSGSESVSAPAQQGAAGPAPQAEARATGYSPSQPGSEAPNPVYNQPGAQAPSQGVPGYAAQHQGYHQPQYQPEHQPGYQSHPQQAAHAPAGYGYPYPGAALDGSMNTAAYPGAYPPHYYAGYSPLQAFAGYPAGPMPHQAMPMAGHAAAPMGGQAAAAMAGMSMPGAPGAGAQAGAGQGPGPQAGMQQLFEELAEGGNGLNSLTRMLSLDDTEFWKGALVGAAAVLLLTNDQVQDALFKSGAKAKSAVKSGADQLKGRASTASGNEDDS